MLSSIAQAHDVHIKVSFFHPSRNATMKFTLETQSALGFTLPMPRVFKSELVKVPLVLDVAVLEVCKSETLSKCSPLRRYGQNLHDKVYEISFPFLDQHNPRLLPVGNPFKYHVLALNL